MKESADDEYIDQLIEQSSLGTPAAKAMRARVSDEQVDKVWQRLEQLDAEDSTP